MTSRGTVLVVDDSSPMRQKMAAAAKAIGYTCSTCQGGAEALDFLRANSVDVVLLDIVMPGMDGFAVLREMKADPRLAEIPVIVISSLEDMESAVRAIELGAEDFLPKAFDPVLFRARIDKSLEKKRVRDVELEYFRQVNKLAKAAQILKSGNYNPAKLGIGEVSQRSDALGDLARVFADAAQKVYERERLLRQTVLTLRGTLALLGVGFFWGLIVPLSKLASNFGAEPFAMTFWVCLFSGVVCTLIAVVYQTFPKFDEIPWNHFVAYALISAVISESIMYFVAGKLDASIIAIIVVMEGFLGFMFAALLKIEAATPIRLLGLVAGFTGVAVILLDQFEAGENASILWAMVALAIPLCYALEGLFLAAKRPAHIGLIPSLAIMNLIAAAIVLPLTLITGQFFVINLTVGKLEGTIYAIVACSVIGNLLFLYLVFNTGPVFASQSAYMISIAGIGWSILLLGERLSEWMWLAVGLMALGLFLVGAKKEAELEAPLIDDPIIEPPQIQEQRKTYP